MTRDAREIANAILDVAQESKINLTNLSLNKILYFTHAWYIALYDEPLVNSYFEAWQFGPVHPKIYQQLKSFGDRTIAARLTRVDAATGEDIPYPVALSREEREHIEKMTRFYGAKSARWLVNASHEVGAPWDQVWLASQGSAQPGMKIPDDMTRDFYRAKLKRRL